MNLSLSDRIDLYKDSTKYILLNKLPVCIQMSIRSFNRVSKKLDKPYDSLLADLMSKTLLSTISEIDNSVFGYYYYDTLTIIIKNDHNKDDSAWLSNDVQKMASVSSSLATYNFHKLLNEYPIKLDITGSVLFDSLVYALPSAEETLNSLIDSQNKCIINTINLLSYDFYAKKIGKNAAASFLEKKNTSDRILLLKEEFNFDIKTDCKSEVLYGIAAYKIPYIYNNESVNVRKNKWILDKNLFKFSDDKNYILNILNSGHDVFRLNRDLGE